MSSAVPVIWLLLLWTGRYRTWLYIPVYVPVLSSVSSVSPQTNQRHVLRSVLLLVLVPVRHQTPERHLPRGLRQPRDQSSGVAHRGGAAGPTVRAGTSPEPGARSPVLPVPPEPGAPGALPVSFMLTLHSLWMGWASVLLYIIYDLLFILT